MKKALVELGSDEEEGKSERKVINQIFGRLLHPKKEVRYLENIGVFVTKVIKANIIAVSFCYS